jgi:hypothetical protein
MTLLSTFRHAVILCAFFAVAVPAMAAEAPPPRSRSEIEAVLRAAPSRGSAAKPLKIMLVAGPKDHGPGEHDYPKWQKDWSALMAKAENVTVTTAFPWPTAEQWEGVDLAVFYLKTRWDAGQLEEIRRRQARGVGMVTIHWAIGCDQGWDQHAECFGLSFANASYRHGAVDLKLTAMDHPILRGLPRQMAFVDEPYWPFIGDRSKVQVLAVSGRRHGGVSAGLLDVSTGGTGGARVRFHFRSLHVDFR